MNPVHVNAVKCQFPCCCPRSVLHTPPGDCHLTGWSEWSTCELTCIDGRSFETMGRQSRSRTFIIQSFENQDSCPQQVLETRPCTGTKSTFQFSALITEAHSFLMSGIMEPLLSYLLAGGKCYHYTWKASLWNNNERTVWCQRSDGVNVTGIPTSDSCGCFLKI